MAPSGVLKSKGKLMLDGLKLLKEEVKQTFSGAKNSHRRSCSTSTWIAIRN
jgi:hypothetical protein